MIRLFDLFVSLIGIVLLLPIFFFTSLLIAMNSGLPVLFLQERVGKGGKTFLLIKFRTMKNDGEDSSLLTIGYNDKRITTIGFYLRKYKLDELPQLFNVFIGNMSFVGPRPEVAKYVALYSEIQRQALSVRPGITDLASLEYINENELLAASDDPEKTYIEKIMPHKLEININYLKNRTIYADFKVIFKTILKIVVIS